MNIFNYYFQRTCHLSVYQYQKLNELSIELIFPYVVKLILIDCSRLGISHLLYPYRFPKLKQIVYLSGHPGCYNIHKRFPKSVSWIFPNYDYAFYNCMLEAGFGKKSNTIISENIYCISNKNNITSFDILVPGYGCIHGPMYNKYMYNYFHQPEIITRLSENDLLSDKKENIKYLTYLKTYEITRFHNYKRQCLEKDVMNHILKDA